MSFCIDDKTINLYSFLSSKMAAENVLQQIEDIFAAVGESLETITDFLIYFDATKEDV